MEPAGFAFKAGGRRPRNASTGGDDAGSSKRVKLEDSSTFPVFRGPQLSSAPLTRSRVGTLVGVLALVETVAQDHATAAAAACGSDAHRDFADVSRSVVAEFIQGARALVTAYEANPVRAGAENPKNAVNRVKSDALLKQIANYEQELKQWQGLMSKYAAVPETMDSDESLDPALLKEHDAADDDMTERLDKALSDLDTLAQGMRAVARRMKAATQGQTQASMAFRTESSAGGGAAGDPKALLRQISSAAVNSEQIRSPRRLLLKLSRE